MIGGLDLLDSLIEPGCIIRVEEQVRIEPWTLERGGFGTSDVIIIYPDRREIIVFDWKYGKIAVSPVENDQEVLYALGVWETVAGEIFNWEPEDIAVKLIIWQPRVPGGGGEWETTMEWLLQEGQQIRIDAAATYDEDAPRIPGGKQCQYCKFQPKCPEFARWNLKQIGLKFEDIDEGIELDVSPPLDEAFGEWTPERRSYVWLHRKAITRWLKMLGEQIMFDYQKGRDTPMIKAVPGNRGHRKWRDEEMAAVRAYLDANVDPDKAWTPITPAALQELIGKKRYEEDLKDYVTQSEAKPMLVPLTDTRKAIPSNMVHFEGIDPDEEDGEE